MGISVFFYNFHYFIVKNPFISPNTTTSQRIACAFGHSGDCALFRAKLQAPSTERAVFEGKLGRFSDAIIQHGTVSDVSRFDDALLPGFCLL